MNLPDAFYTSRVTEALESLALHVTSARNIAASLKPIKTAKLKLKREEQPRAIISSVTPSKIDSSKITGDGVEFKIRGKNLTTDEVNGFELFLEDDPGVSFPDDPAMVTQVNDRELKTALVDLSEAPSGSYEVRITDENHTPHLPGFIVEVKADETYRESGMPLTIDIEPKSDGFVLTVKPTGNPLSYTWYKDGKLMQNERKNTLWVPAKPASLGVYSVAVSYPDGLVATGSTALH